MFEEIHEPANAHSGENYCINILKFNMVTQQNLHTKPLIATLEISASAQSYFNQLRRKHFPAHRNYIEAHLTLFHALPDQPEVFKNIKMLSADQQPFEATALSIVSLGNGTAFKITSSQLPLLHQKLQRIWFDRLSNQDKQKRNFHITIQNKVETGTANLLQKDLAAGFHPFNFSVVGIQLWRYHDGPWEYLDTFKFGDKSRSGIHDSKTVEI
jgi:2'-5' RNA ligase